MKIKKNFSELSLSELLEKICNGNGYRWALRYCEAVGDLRPIVRQGDLVKLNHTQDAEILLGWQDLVALALRFEDITEIELIGRPIDTADRRAHRPIKISLDDSSFWTIFPDDVFDDS